MKKVTLTIGGAPEFKDRKQAFKGIEDALKANKITLKSIEKIWGVGDVAKQGAEDGAYEHTREWCNLKKITFGDGTPTFYRNGVFDNDAVSRRNNYMAENTSLYINLVSGKSTGGNGLIERFNEEGKRVHVVQQDIPDVINFPPTKQEVAQAIKIFSKQAKEMLSKAVMIDVETTGLHHLDDDIVELAVVDCMTLEVIYSSFIYTPTLIQERAYAVNNIEQHWLEDMPTLEEAWAEVYPKIKGKLFVASNSDFDEKMICFGLTKKKVESPSEQWFCLQRFYRKYSCLGTKQLKSLNTGKIATQMGVVKGTHRAYTDAIAQAEILKAMAKGVVPKY